MRGGKQHVHNAVIMTCHDEVALKLMMGCLVLIQIGLQSHRKGKENNQVVSASIINGHYTIRTVYMVKYKTVDPHCVLWRYCGIAYKITLKSDLFYQQILTFLWAD